MPVWRWSVRPQFCDHLMSPCAVPLSKPPASRTSDPFDIVIAFEERVFDAILEDMQRRGNVTMQPVLVINLVRSQGRSPAEGKRAVSCMGEEQHTVDADVARCVIESRVAPRTGQARALSVDAPTPPDVSPPPPATQDVRDNAEEASLAAPKALQLCQMVRCRCTVTAAAPRPLPPPIAAGACLRPLTR